MDFSPTSVPETNVLEMGLRHVLGADGIRVLQREFNDYSRTFASEIVTCRWPNGREDRLFCKYMFELADDHRDHGSRGGVVYEAMIYDRVLRSLPVGVPICHGTYADPATGGNWLILQYVDSAIDLDRAMDDLAVVKAASWLGSFHAVQQKRLASLANAGLTAYDTAFYGGWIERTARFAERWRQRVPWLHKLREGVATIVERLLAVAPTVIHGEFYPHNILVRGEEIYPVDWESAAVAAGEIDLASLTDGWDAAEVNACEQAYCRARWPAGAPAEFAEVLAYARLYLQIRWLADQPDESAEQDDGWRFEELDRAGKCLGLIGD